MSTTSDPYPEPEAVERFNPFPGLRPFAPDEDYLFFGREQQTDELLERLHRRRFLGIIGTSGSGKSSLILSGLVPSLFSGYMIGAGSSWRVAVLRPGEDPIGNLAAALAKPEILGPDDPDEATDAEINRELLEASLLCGELGLVEVVRHTRLPPEDNLLVIVDQFEELFRFKAGRVRRQSDEDSQAFVKLLLAAADQEELPIFIAITMRSDFIGDCTHFPGLAEAINDGQYLVPRMNRDERRRAITGPVAVGGAEISPRLLSRLLNDVGDNPDQLPILQHALMRTWDDWLENHTEGEALDLHHYEAIGTMKDALSQHAEEAFQELDEDHQRFAEKTFKALTDKGTDVRGIRSPRALAELSELTGAGADEVRTVVECFRKPGRSFLMPPFPRPLAADTILDISHESLMRNWVRLVQWSDDEARSAQTYLRLAEAAKRYQGSESAGLLHDPELEAVLNWRDETRPTPAWARRYDPAFERAMGFLDASYQERERQVREREQRRRRRLARAKRLAFGAVAAALAFAFVGLYAIDQRNQADIERLEAEGARQEAEDRKQEAERAQLEAETRRRDAEVAERRAEIERRKAETAKEEAEGQRQEALVARQEAETRRRESELAREDADEQREQAEKQKKIAENNADKAERQKKIAEEQREKADRLSLLAGGRALAEQSLALPAGQEELAALLAVEAYRLHMEAETAGAGGPEPNVDSGRQPHVYGALVRAWQALAPERLRLATSFADAVTVLAVGGDTGDVLVAGGEDGRVEHFDLNRPGAPGVPIAESGTAVRSLALGTGGDFAVGGLDGTIRAGHLGSGSSTVRPAHAGAVYSLAFAGERLVSGGADGAVKLWRATSLEEGEEERLLAGGPAVRALALASDGHTLAAAHGGQGTGRAAILVWDLWQPQQAPRALELDHDVHSMTFGPRDRRLAAGTRDGSVLLWDSFAEPPRRLSQHGARINAIAWSGPDLLATASHDSRVRLLSLDRDRGELVPIDLHHSGWMLAVALTADGETVISAGQDATVLVRPTRMAPLAAAICARVGRDLTSAERADYLPENLDYRPTCPGGAAP